MPPFLGPGPGNLGEGHLVHPIPQVLSQRRSWSRGPSRPEWRRGCKGHWAPQSRAPRERPSLPRETRASRTRPHLPYRTTAPRTGLCPPHMRPRKGPALPTPLQATSSSPRAPPTLVLRDPMSPNPRDNPRSLYFRLSQQPLHTVSAVRPDPELRPELPLATPSP